MSLLAYLIFNSFSSNCSSNAMFLSCRRIFSSSVRIFFSTDSLRLYNAMSFASNSAMTFSTFLSNSIFSLDQFRSTKFSSPLWHSIWVRYSSAALISAGLNSTVFFTPDFRIEIILGI